LFDPTVVDGANDYFTAMNPGSTVPGGSGDAIDAYSYPTGKIEVRAAAQSASAGTGTALTLGTTYLIVEEIDLTAKTASLWIKSRLKHLWWHRAYGHCEPFGHHSDSGRRCRV